MMKLNPVGEAHIAIVFQWTIRVFLAVLSAISFQEVQAGALDCAAVFNRTGRHLPQNVFHKLETELSAIGQKHDVPGFSVSLNTGVGGRAEPGVLFSENFALGVKTLNRAGRVSASTLAPIGSISKLYTALSIFRLLDRGIVSLDAPLTTYSKARFVKALSARSPEKMYLLDQITIRHLLTHQSGLMQDLPGANMWWDPGAIANGRLVSHKNADVKIHDIDLLFSPGRIPTGMKYSNLGFDLLSQIVQAYGGHRTFESFVEHEVFKPLGLNESKYFVDPKSDDLVSLHGNRGAILGGAADARLVLPHITDAGSYSGSIGVSSTSRDLARLGRELLGMLSDEKKSDFLGIRMQLLEAIRPASRNSGSASWGQGFHLVNIDGYIGIGHTGTNFGSRAILYMFPELDFVFAATFNSRDVVREDFLRASMKLLLEEGQLQPVSSLNPRIQATLDEIRAFQKDTHVVAPVKPVIVDINDIPDSLKPFVGTYHSDITGAQPVRVSTNGRLVFWGNELIPDQMDPNLFHFPANLDAYSSGEPVRFVRGETGDVIGIYANYVLFAPKVRNADESQVTDLSAWRLYMNSRK